MNNPSPALVERATKYKQDTNNKDWKSIPHLMASFAEEESKEESWKIFRDYDKETGLTENELKRAFENYWETRNKERGKE